MSKILIILTRESRLRLLDGTEHPSGFWAEEFVVPYERFIKEGYDIDLATVGGQRPTPDQGSLTPQTVGYTRPIGSPDHDEESVAHYRDVIDSLDLLRSPMDIAELSLQALADYTGVYVSGGHGAMGDLPNSPAVTQVMRWIFELDKPLAVVCHGHSALLSLRDGHGRWPLEGRQMTAFSHDEELVTDMAGKLPFVLQVELERLGAHYHKAELIWGSCVVQDGNLITGQNPYSSTELAETFVEHLGKLASV
jgi:putative intracellular protease/amidase